MGVRMRVDMSGGEEEEEEEEEGEGWRCGGPGASWTLLESVVSSSALTLESSRVSGSG